MKRKQIALLLSLLLSVSPVAESAAVWGADFTDSTAVEQTQEEETGETGNQAADEEETAEEVPDFASEEISFSAGEEQNAEVTAFSDEEGEEDGEEESIRYEAEVYSETGTWVIPSGTEITAGVDLYKISTDKDGHEEGRKNFETDYRIILGKYSDKYVRAAVSGDDKKLIITAKDRRQSGEDYDDNNSTKIPITISLEKENETIETSVEVYVRECSYIIKMDNELKTGHVAVGLGDELDLSSYGIKTMYYDSDNLGGKEESDVRYRVDYKEDAWEKISEGDNGLPKLRRKGNWDTSISIYADKQDEESDEWHQVSETEFWIHEMHYDAKLDFSYGSERQDMLLYGENAAPLTLTALQKSDSEDMSNFTVEWKVEQYIDNEDNDNMADPECVTYTTGSSGTGMNNDQITLEAKKDYNFNNKDLRLKVTAIIKNSNDEEVTNVWTALWLTDAVKNINFPNDQNLLPGWDMSIWSAYRGYIVDKDYLEGRDVWAHVTEVAIEDPQSAVRYEQDEEGNYHLKAVKEGNVKVTLNYYLSDSEEGEPGKEVEDSYSFNVSVKRENYYGEYHYSSNETGDFGVILSGSEAVVTTALYKQTYDIEEDDYETSDVNDYQIKPVHDANGNPVWDSELITVTVEDNHTLRIKTNKKNQRGYTEIPIEFVVNGETVCSEIVYVNVENDIHYITPSELKDENGDNINVNVGQSIDFSKCNIATYHIGSGETESSKVPKEEILYRVEYDPNAWSSDLPEEEEYGLPVLKRTATYGNSVDVIAYRKFTEGDNEPYYEEVGRTSYWFDDVSTELEFTYSYGSEENARVYTDGELTLSLKDSRLNLSDEMYDVNWSVYRMEDGERIENVSDIVNVGETRTRITLKAKSGHDGERFHVEAVVKIGEKIIASCINEIRIQEPIYYLDGIESYQQILNDKNYGFVFSKDESGKVWRELYEENGANPDGKITRVLVKNIVVDNEDVIKKTDESDRIELHPENAGTTTLTFEIEDENGVSLRPVTVTMEVNDEITRVDYIKLEGKSDTGDLLPGDSVKAEPVVMRSVVDTDGYTVTETLTKGEDYTIRYCDYDPYIVSVDENGVITGLNRGNTWVGFEISDLNGNVIAYGGRYIFVSGRYYVIEPDEENEIYLSSDGKEQKVNLRAMVYGLTNLDGKQDTDGTFVIGDTTSLINASVKNGVLVLNAKANLDLKPGNIWGCDVTVEYQKDGNTVTSRTYRVLICNHTAKETGRVWPSCNSGGYVNYKCETCGYTWQETLGAYGHSWDNGVVTKEATCTTAGTKTYTCKDCRSTYTETIKATGEHKWDEGVITKEATCTEDGVKTYTCTVCKETKTETIKAEDAHKWDEGVITKEATCTEDGVKTYTCTLCKKTRTETIKATNKHQWDKGVITQKATCTKDGVRTYTCSVCHTEKTETIPALKHKWSAWKTKSAATVLKAKVQERICSTCKKTQTRTTGEKLTPKATLNVKSLKLKKKQKTTAFKITGMAKGDYVKSWKSSDTNVVKVSGKKDGTCTITAQKQAGTATITITFASGLVKTLKVKVQAPTVKTTAISNIAKKATLKKGKTLELKPVLEPITSGEEITYESSDPTIAKVSKKGVVTALKPGTVTITIKSGKLTVTCKITVKK